jgi:hypothetical protein
MSLTDGGNASGERHASEAEKTCFRPASFLAEEGQGYLLFEPGDFVMMRKMMLGIKQRAEAPPGG